MSIQNHLVFSHHKIMRVFRQSSIKCYPVFFYISQALFFHYLSNLQNFDLCMVKLINSPILPLQFFAYLSSYLQIAKLLVNFVQFFYKSEWQSDKRKLNLVTLEFFLNII